MANGQPSWADTKNAGLAQERWINPRTLDWLIHAGQDQERSTGLTQRTLDCPQAPLLANTLEGPRDLDVGR
ncbi:hypothetical protein DdX_14057 [Ditylenchus destructor]|uniref:Uncharacterized protein n=1 Tax=Ditylenchus destructor TaxID=166010 RepID=A0AAD4MV56_9BILA|nr:hypothetical protein DdX_14057 [Ditylenchus destructor]